MKKGIELINDINSCITEKGKVSFWWLGQLGFVVKLGEKVIYIDPYISESPRRNIPPLLKPEEITNADFILGTHDHSDHIDRKVWHQLSLSSPNAKFIVPQLLIESLSKDLDIPLHRFVGLDDGKELSMTDLKITGIASAHEFLDRDPVTGAYPYLGYIIEGNSCVIYHSGDTCIYEGMHSKLKKFNRFDVMFIPINGRDGKRLRANCIGNMTYQEAVDLVGDLNPKLAVPGHYEMFSTNSENPLLFADYMDVKYPHVKYWIGQHGEKIVI